MLWICRPVVNKYIWVNISETSGCEHFELCVVCLSIQYLGAQCQELCQDVKRTTEVHALGEFTVTIGCDQGSDVGIGRGSYKAL